VGRTDHRGQDRNQDPGAYVINRCAGKCGRAKVGAEEFVFLQNSGEYGKCCDAHGRAHKKREGNERNVLQRIPVPSRGLLGDN
jgi:hypothetical protein